jgi:hypothetical protein
VFPLTGFYTISVLRRVLTDKRSVDATGQLHTIKSVTTKQCRFSCFLFFKHEDNEMYKEDELTVWNTFLETPRRRGSLMRLDRILKRRMKAFLKARIATLNEMGIQ